MPPNDRRDVALVLSGGGARGIAHIGVLRILEQQHIPIHCIAGTSMGAIVGGLYAAGYSADELERIVRDLDWSEQFDDKPPRRERSQQQKDEDFDFPVSLELGYGDGHLRLPKGTVGGVGFEAAFGEHVSRLADKLERVLAERALFSVEQLLGFSDDFLAVHAVDFVLL